MPQTPNHDNTQSTLPGTSTGGYAAGAGGVGSGPLVTPDQGGGSGTAHITPDQSGVIDNSNLVINSGNQDAAELAEKIAKGYAWGKHVVKKGEFYGIVSDEREFKELIERIIKNPSETKQLANGRQGYWDDKTETLVITSPKDKDGGACFRPDNGKDYYDNSLE